MNNRKTNQDRINELKSKIFYAKAARDNYKETHAMLYETNSFYIEKLKQELSGLEAQRS